MTSLKANLRAWLIDLVREAIRIEWEISRAKPAKSYPARISHTTPVPFSGVIREAWDATEPKTNLTADMSFEQMQADAIKEQEKFYEPERP